MPSSQITDLAAYKHQRNLLEAQKRVSELTEIPITWCFRPAVLEFMKTHCLTAPDLLSIMRTACKFDFQHDGSSFIVSGHDTEGTEFSLQLVLYPEAMRIKLLKIWKIAQASQQTA